MLSGSIRQRAHMLTNPRTHTHADPALPIEYESKQSLLFALNAFYFACAHIGTSLPQSCNCFNWLSKCLIASFAGKSLNEHKHVFMCFTCTIYILYMVTVHRAILAGNAFSAEHCDKLNSIQASQCSDMACSHFVCRSVCVDVCINLNENSQCMLGKGK